MTIHELGPGLSGPNGPRRTREKDEPARKEPDSSSSSTGRTDRVEISDEGRALSSQVVVSEASVPTLTSDRMEEILHRIDSGAYDTDEMAEEVARRLLISGDL